jgi:hypothetical protein
MARDAGSYSPHVDMEVIGKWAVRSEGRACLFGRRNWVKRKCSTWWRVAGADCLYTSSGPRWHCRRAGLLGREDLCKRWMQPAPVIRVTMTGQ